MEETRPAVKFFLERCFIDHEIRVLDGNRLRCTGCALDADIRPRGGDGSVGHIGGRRLLGDFFALLNHCELLRGAELFHLRPLHLYVACNVAVKEHSIAAGVKGTSGKLISIGENNYVCPGFFWGSSANGMCLARKQAKPALKKYVPKTKGGISRFAMHG